MFVVLHVYVAALACVYLASVRYQGACFYKTFDVANGELMGLGIIALFVLVFRQASSHGNVPCLTNFPSIVYPDTY